MQLCPVCQLRGRISMLTKHNGYYSCGKCSRIFTGSGLKKSKQKATQEWDFRIQRFRSGYQPGIQ